MSATLTIHSLPALLLTIAGICGIVPRASIAAWPLVLATGVVWLVVG